MAGVQLGSVAEGTVVKIKRDGSLRNFCVAKHDYEITLNGYGRTLLVEINYPEACGWCGDSLGVTEIGQNKYAGETLDKYLNTTYAGQFDEDIRNAMGRTTFYYTPGNNNKNVSTLSRAVFALSGTERGFSETRMNVEGEPLSAGVLAKITDSSATWTRSPDNNSTSMVWRIINGSTAEMCTPKGYRVSVWALPCPAFTLPASLCVDDTGIVFINTAPSTPGSISVPAAVNGGTTITVSWSSSTDAESNLEGYIVQRSTDGGSTWTQIYQGSARSTTNTVAFGTASVMYRVKAYDSEGLESGWRTSAQRTVVNNHAPTAPGSISVPVSVYGGSPLTVSWTAASDSDGSISGYALERQADGGDWTEIYRGPALAFTDSVTRGWQTVAYRVRAYDNLDACGAYTSSEVRTVDNNFAPVIACALSGDMGVKREGFSVPYSVSDKDGDAITVTEAADGVTLRTFLAEPEEENALRLTGQDFMKVLNGPRTLTITASDGKVSSVHALTFTKAVHAASVTLTEPMEADAEISVCALSVTGSLPADAVFKAEVTNNALDETPVWEDCASAVRAGVNYVFENKTAARGFAFSFRVSVKRGPSGQGGFITSIQGGFQ